MTAALAGGESSAARPGRNLPPEKTRYPFYRRLGGLQGRSGRAENLVHTGIRSWTVQPGSSVAISIELPGPQSTGVVALKPWRHSQETAVLKARTYPKEKSTDMTKTVPIFQTEICPK